MSSSSVSQTQYRNNAPTVQDNENPIVGGRNQFGELNAGGNLSVGDRAVAGSTLGNKNTISMLDGGAIEQAFSFGSGTVEQVLDLAASAFSNASQAQGTLLDILDRQSSSAADTAEDAANPEAATEKRNQMLLFGFGALLVLVYVIQKRGK